MNIAFVYDCVYPFSYGGGEKRHWELARELVQRSHSVSILGQKWWSGPDVLTRDGVRIVGIAPNRPLFTPSGRRSFSQPFFFALHVFRHLRRNRYDVVECANFPYLSCIAARLAAPRTPLAISWFEVRGFRGWLRYNGPSGIVAALFEKICMRLTRRHSAISPLTASRFPRPIPVVPCGVQTVLFETDRPRTPASILYVGRLVPHKRLDMLLDAVAQLLPDFPALTLTLIGDGSAKADLLAQAKSLGLSDCLRINDSHPPDDAVHNAYLSSSVFVLPSEQEGFGIVLVEAMAAALPPIVRVAPDSASSALVNPGKTGLLFSTLPELVSALRTLLADPARARAMGLAAREAARPYAWPAIAASLESFLAP